VSDSEYSASLAASLVLIAVLRSLNVGSDYITPARSRERERESLKEN
jgi:hypothetical protein